jgi:hypothetical protein
LKKDFYQLLKKQGNGEHLFDINTIEILFKLKSKNSQKTSAFHQTEADFDVFLKENLAIDLFLKKS